MHSRGYALAELCTTKIERVLEMPIYDYKCTGCGTIYDVFHKVREIEEDIVCPTCGSNAHVRLISAPSISVKGKSLSMERPLPPCGDDSCCGGSCALN